MELQAALPKLGQTWQGYQIANPTAPNSVFSGYGSSVQLEGAVGTFPHVSLSITGNMRNRVSGREMYCLFVRNTTGGVLLPGQHCDWESGYRGRRVDAKNTASSNELAGVVDPYLPAAGVPDDDLFWLIRRGPAYVRMVNAAYTIDLSVVPDAAAAGSGKNKGTAYAFGDMGLVQEAKTTTTGDPFLLVDLKLDWY